MEAAALLRPFSFSAATTSARVDTRAMQHVTVIEALKVGLGVVCALVAAFEAMSKKRSGLVWAVLGFLYPLISVAVIYALPAASPKAKRVAEPRERGVLEETSSVLAQAQARLGRTF